MLPPEPDIYPLDLLDDASPKDGVQWWALYTLARREKELMRRLSANRVGFYAPHYVKPTRSPAGRIRSSFAPLFASYVFLFGDDDHRRIALESQCVARTLPVPTFVPLTHELRQIRLLLEEKSDAPITPEDRLAPGSAVRIKSGKLRGLEGVLVRRAKEERLLVAVDFLQKGASIEVADFEVEAVY